MNDLQIFNYHDTPLRTVEKDLSLIHISEPTRLL